MANPYSLYDYSIYNQLGLGAYPNTEEGGHRAVFVPEVTHQWNMPSWTQGIGDVNVYNPTTQPPVYEPVQPTQTTQPPVYEPAQPTQTTGQTTTQNIGQTPQLPQDQSTGPTFGDVIGQIGQKTGVNALTNAIGQLVTTGNLDLSKLAGSIPGYTAISNLLGGNFTGGLADIAGLLSTVAGQADNPVLPYITSNLSSLLGQAASNSGIFSPMVSQMGAELVANQGTASLSEVAGAASTGLGMTLAALSPVLSWNSAAIADLPLYSDVAKFAANIPLVGSFLAPIIEIATELFQGPPTPQTPQDLQRNAAISQNYAGMLNTLLSQQPGATPLEHNTLSIGAYNPNLDWMNKLILTPEGREAMNFQEFPYVPSAGISVDSPEYKTLQQQIADYNYNIWKKQVIYDQQMKAYLQTPEGHAYDKGRNSWLHGIYDLRGNLKPEYANSFPNLPTDPFKGGTGYFNYLKPMEGSTYGYYDMGPGQPQELGIVPTGYVSGVQTVGQSYSDYVTQYGYDPAQMTHMAAGGTVADPGGYDPWLESGLTDIYGMGGSGPAGMFSVDYTDYQNRWNEEIAKNPQLYASLGLTPVQIAQPPQPTYNQYADMPQIFWG